MTFNGHTIEEWENLLREGADSFIAWASALPPEERAEALRHGRDVLARKAVKLSADGRTMTAAERDANRLPVTGLPLGVA